MTTETDPLALYNAKRDFAKTAEPAGDAGSRPWQQLHGPEA